MPPLAIAYEIVVDDLFQENTYIVHLPERDDCVIVDPGLNPDRIVEQITQLGKQPVAIINTHGHADHIAGNAYLKQEWPDIPLVIGEGDAYKLGDPVANLSANYGFDLISPPADRTVREGDSLEVAGVCWHVRETPGHSAGHVVFIAKEAAPPLVLGGDVLFQGSIGRSDFPDGDFAALASSIKEKLYTLPDETIVLPGHGPETRVGVEKRSNPFVRG
ncbi:MAG: MBL fold metallo-hydrolase [Planctomycetales bacterium]|nr:MBL fold metallo-hydrolase [Planctomycetales bacterium]